MYYLSCDGGGYGIGAIQTSCWSYS